MSSIIVDSNVIIDLLTCDPTWYDWSARQMASLIDKADLIINPIIYSEISIGFDRIEPLEKAIIGANIQRHPIPWEAAFLAGKAFKHYKQLGGKKTSTLPDFYIGAHAAVTKFTILTRDVRRYKTYFPTVSLIAPQH